MREPNEQDTRASAQCAAPVLAPAANDLSARTAWIACVALIAVWGAYLASTLGEVDYRARADEAWYLRYTGEVCARGWRVFPELFASYLGDPAAQVYPNPLRVLYIVVSAFWCSVFGVSYASLSSLSLCAHLATALVSFAAARRHFGAARSLVFACALAASPLLSGLARRALTDSFATLTLALFLWSFLAWTCDFTSRKRAWLCAIALGASLVTKENHVLFVAPCALFLAWLALARGVSVPWGRASLVLGVPIASAGAVFLLAAGGVEPLWRTARVILASPATNPYAIRYGAGPWYRYLIDFVALSPWVMLAALGGVALVLLGREVRGRVAAEFFVILVVVALATFALFTKNVRYVAVLEIAWRALAVVFAFELVRRWGARWAVWACLALGAAACTFDVVTFRSFFIAHELYDPTSAALLGLRGLVPLQLPK